jgi:hypothetical protein
MPDNPVTIYSAANITQAHVLKQALADVGIEAWVEAGLDNQMGHHDASFLPRVIVREQDAEDAREIALEYDAVLRVPRRSAGSSDETDSAVGEVIEPWPECPECHAKRHAACRVCGGIRESFRPAHAIEEANHDELAAEGSGSDLAASRLYECEDCDDVAPVRLFRYCPECNFDFGNGHVIELPSPPEKLNRTAVLIFFVMLAGMLGLMGYFSLLLRH